MAQVRDKLYFLTDAHLGSGDDSRDRELEICHFLDTIAPDCKVLMLLGDMFDFWFTYRHLVPRGNVRLLGKIAELCDKGIEVHFFIGNHDMWMFDYLTSECGVIMHDDPIEYTFDGKRFLIGHGDGLGHLDKGFDLIRRVFRSRANQRLFALLPASLTFPIARRWSDSNKGKHAREDTLRFLGEEREGIILYCKQRLEHEHFDYCVFGHRHTPMVREISEGCTYVNVGDWMFNRNYAVYDPADGRLTLHDHREQLS